MDKKRFKELLQILSKNAPKGKATAQLEASKNPMEYLKKHKNQRKAFC